MTVIINGTTGIQGPSWTTAGRPTSPSNGEQGYNSTLKAVEIYLGTQWRIMGRQFSATGGTETTDGAYTVHTFTSDGTFSPNSLGFVDYLVVGGGGAGGGSYRGGGGGAGAFRTAADFAVFGESIAVTVGAGGTPVQYQAGGTGESSVFSTITSLGGGGGGKYLTDAPAGSYGSGGGNGGGASAGPGATSGTYGNDGGGGVQFAGAQVGGGGGGASAVGYDADDGTAGLRGDGGAGTANSYSGSAVTYAGGGSGGNYGTGNDSVGGVGGGGDGHTGTPYGDGEAGTANTGGGGGGASGEDVGSFGTGGAGGSGIVIIRYLT